MELTLTAARAGKLSSFLKNELKMSTGLVNKVKWADGLRVNGLSCHTNYQVEPGDVIAVRLEEAQPERSDSSIRAAQRNDKIRLFMGFAPFSLHGVPAESPQTFCLRLFLTDRADVNDNQQKDHDGKQQGGDGVDLRADMAARHGVDLHCKV